MNETDAMEPSFESAAPRPGDRDRAKADALRRRFEEDPIRERDLEPHEIAKPWAPGASADAPVEASAYPPVEPPRPREGPGPFDAPRGRMEEAPHGVRPPPPHRDRDARDRGRHGRGRGHGHEGPERRVGMDDRRPDPVVVERDRLRGALSSADGRIRNLQREVDTLRNRLRALATGAPPAPPPASAPGSPPPAPEASRGGESAAADRAPRDESGIPRAYAGTLRDQRVAVLLDFPGLLDAARRRGRSIAVPRLLASIVRGRRLVRAIAYGAPAIGGEVASALRNAGFELRPGDGSVERASADARALAARVDALVALGFEDAFAPAYENARETGTRCEVAGFEPHDAPGLAAVAHAFLRIGEEGVL